MTQYINKDALDTVLRKLWKEDNRLGNTTRYTYNEALQDIQCEIDALEVKEVDLEKEIDDWYNTMGIPVTTDALKETAKHFFELGLKVQKGE